MSTTLLEVPALAELAIWGLAPAARIGHGLGEASDILGDVRATLVAVVFDRADSHGLSGVFRTFGLDLDAGPWNGSVSPAAAKRSDE